MKKILISVFALISTFSYAENELEKQLKSYLDVKGARVTTGVEVAKAPYSLEFVQEARENFNNFHLQMGGDHTLYYNEHISEFLPVAIAAPNEDYVALEKNYDLRINNLRMETKQGNLTLDEYMANPMFRTQGVMMIHKGKIVYENFAGLNPQDLHVWMSSAKTITGFLVADLVNDKKIDTNKMVPFYVPELKNTVWDKVKVIDVLNHTTALDTEETLDSILSIDSEIVRFFSASFGAPNPKTNLTENWLDVLKDLKPLENEKTGERFRYSSMNTMILIKIIENIENKKWIDIFEEKVWGNLKARLQASVALTPDGTAMACGIVSSTLEDFAKYGMLFTPSWKVVSDVEVVGKDDLELIYKNQNKKAFKDSAKDESIYQTFGERAQGVSYQFDAVFEDGALYKSGNLGQGIYIDPERDFVGVYVSTNPYVDGFGEVKMPGYLRQAAKLLNGK